MIVKHHFYMESLSFNIEDKEITVLSLSQHWRQRNNCFFFAEKRNNYLCLNIEDRNNVWERDFVVTTNVWRGKGIQIRIRRGMWGLPLISLHVGHTFGRPLWIYTKKEWEELSTNYSNFLLNMVNKRLHYLNQISSCTISSLLEEPKIQLCWHWFCNLYI